MRKTTLMTRALVALVSLLWGGHLYAQKTIYIPQEWRQNRSDTLLYAESDPDNQYTWSKSRSRETENVIVLWDKYYGDTSPSDAPSAYRVDIDDLLQKAEAFFDLELNTLGFVDPLNSNLSKYKVMILMNHTTGWVCYGGGYDFQVSALWLSPSTCKPVGQAVAHEIGHSFHYMCYAEASNHGANGSVQTGFHGAVGNGSVTWEQTAQWQAMQSYPELMYDQSIGIFRNSHNYAFTHEWHRYQSYWFFYYLCQQYADIKTVANVWNHPETTVKDFNQVLMDYKHLSVEDLYRLYFDQAMRLVTWDLDACRPYRNSYIGDFNYRCVLTDDGAYQVALSSCPQGMGFNVIPLQLPAAGTQITTQLTGLRAGAALLDADPGEYLDGNSQWSKTADRRYMLGGSRNYRGFRMGYVVLMQNGERRYYADDRVYCQGTAVATESYSFSVPEGADKLWLVVAPALSTYVQHKWDEKIDNDDMWPYQVKFEGTDIGPRAVVYATATLDDRPVGDATFTYDVTFPPSVSAYSGTTVTVGGQAAATLGTAFQLQPTEIANRLQAWQAGGPGARRIMFYAVDSEGGIVDAGSTANGYGHWFDAEGQVSAYADGVLFSEFTPASLSFSIGQYPGRVKQGDRYTIRQALRYHKNGREDATATFVFNISVGGTAEAVLTGVEYVDPRTLGIEVFDAVDDAAPRSVDVFSLTGQPVRRNVPALSATQGLPAGIYLVGGRKVLLK